MVNKFSFLILVLSCLAMALITHAEEKVISKKMADALKKFNPQFVAWKTQDYSHTIQKDAAEQKRHPYAINLDFNSDAKNDLIIDGHDDQQNILLCLLSNSKGYDVIVIRESDLINPKEIESWNDGKKEMGLNYYLWAYNKGKGFTLAYPQQSDSKSNLLNDGVMIDYNFKDGKFDETHQTL